MILNSLDQIEQIDRTSQWIPHSQLPLTLNQAHQALARACRRNIETYSKFVFNYEIPDHAKEWIRAALDPDNQYLLIIAPRESSKTTYMSQIFFSWWLGHNPERTSAILGVTEDVAIQRLLVIRDTIQNHPRFKLVFPYVKPDFLRTWTSTAINIWDQRPRVEGHENGWDYGQWKSWLARSGESTRDHSVRAAGVGSGQVIGNRYSGLVVCDDLIDDKISSSKMLMDRLEGWFLRQLLPCVRPTGKVIYITTRWSPDDLPARLMEKKIETVDPDNPNIIHTRPMWKVLETKALIEDDRGNLRSYWPVNWSVERLLQKKEELGEVIFELMYQNNPYASTGDLFKPEWLEKGLPIKLPTFDLGVFIGIDPAFTKNTRSDNSAITTLGVTKDYRVFNLGMIIGKFDKNELTAAVQRAWAEAEQYGAAVRVLCESVGTQSWVITELIEDTGLPVESVNVTNKGDKVARMQPFSVLCAKGNYHADWTSINGRRHKAELLTAPTGKSDDTIDSCTIIINTIIGKGLMRPQMKVIKPSFMI